ncbi:MAG TPA: Rrf2 family transcriptional regulator [Mariprofundaceae bacterium]|nr:Rrf2 family transcriptional regulator [Mariprofundaceae bacterium]
MLDLLNSRRLRLVLTALLRIAADTKPVSGKLLAEKLHCPRRYLEPDLQSLVQQGILESRRGASGGYLMARNPQRVNLLDILQCLVPERESEALEDACRLQQSIVHENLLKAQHNCEQVLADIQLSKWLEQAEAQGLLHAVSTTPDFCI